MIGIGSRVVDGSGRRAVVVSIDAKITTLRILPSKGVSTGEWSGPTWQFGCGWRPDEDPGLGKP